MEVQFFSNVNTFVCHVGVPSQSCGSWTLSYVTTFFCYVGVPSQSCGSSTLLLCKHFLLPCWCTKQILWEFNSFLMQHFLLPCWCTKPILWEFYSSLMLTPSFAMLVYQTNPVGVLLFSHVNTFFCHVGEPNQSCESSTLFLCKHFLLSCWCTKPILWEFNSSLM